MKLPPWILAVFGWATMTTHLGGAEVVEHDGAKYHLFRVDPAEWSKLQLGTVTFHQFSRFFLHLGCEDVLYLDGDISNMLVHPPADAKLTPNTFAGMFYVAE
ncbi:MAG: hypothetical protein IPK22_09155 [Verrucomicrobiaceae bacterium]|nr:hypothetical protein [Verrucomicrobiaceae bacterium]